MNVPSKIVKYATIVAALIYLAGRLRVAGLLGMLSGCCVAQQVVLT